MTCTPNVYSRSIWMLLQLWCIAKLQILCMGCIWELCMHVEMVSKMCVRLIANSLIKHVNLCSTWYFKSAYCARQERLHVHVCTAYNHHCILHLTCISFLLYVSVTRYFWRSIPSHSIPFHLMAWPWCPRVCHTHSCLSPSNQRRMQSVRTYGGSLQVHVHIM